MLWAAVAAVGSASALETCDPSRAQLVDLMVDNCFIQEGAMRSAKQLEQDLFVYRSEGHFAELFSAAGCVSGDGPPCRCITRYRKGAKECVQVTPELSSDECGTATVDGVDGVRSGEAREVCADVGSTHSVQVSVNARSYTFEVHAPSESEHTDHEHLMTLSADGCKLSPSFRRDTFRYSCKTDCSVGGSVVLAASRGPWESAWLTLVKNGVVQELTGEDGSHYNHSRTIVQELTVSEGNPDQIQIVITPHGETEKQPGAKFQNDDTRVVYTMGVECGTVTTTSTSTVAESRRRAVVAAVASTTSTTSTTTMTKRKREATTTTTSTQAQESKLGEGLYIHMTVLSILFGTLFAMLLFHSCRLGKSFIPNILKEWVEQGSYLCCCCCPAYARVLRGEGYTQNFAVAPQNS